MGFRRWRLLIVVLVAGWAAAAGAQSIEGVLMPGKVIAGHAKYEQECANCHVKFDKAAQDGLCLECHKDVARDTRSKQGFHGRITPEACRSCHTDHKGRDVNIVPFDEKTFDHARTDFVLSGAHRRVACRTCHVTGKKYRDAPIACDGCHRKDDKHKGALGPKCADCHTDITWKEARFDHDKTHFALTFKHVDVACKACHTNNAFRNTPTTCVGCHRKDDKQHLGRLGDKCGACHSAKEWRDVAAFQHDRDTRYALRGKHRAAKCETCHTAAALHSKLPVTCIGCHKTDDKHNATLGTACADCHTERNWREAKYDHEQSAFKLRGKHRDVECRDCHRDTKSYKGTAQTCIECHRKDDTHKDRYGDKCAACHTERTWRDIGFHHDRDTKYALTGRHAGAKCDSCHTGSVYRDKLAVDCISCHGKDDRHHGQLGRECEQCHDTVDWSKTVRFDHNKSRFPLLGRHARAECKSCHATPAYRDARQQCIACHAREDKHKGTLGVDCATCHNARDWKIWDFDHARRTRFALDGAHRDASCISCHKLGGDKVAPLPTTCAACHRGDDVHGGQFGAQCGRCHETRTWREIKSLGRRGAIRIAPEAVVALTGASP
ncbi:MAG: cytochrome C [Betaproteobacteria bacterium]